MSKAMVNDFVFNSLLPDVLLRKAKGGINISKAFKVYLNSLDNVQGNPDEIAEKYSSEVVRKISVKTLEFESLGVPRFLEPYEEGNDTFLCWYHPKFEETTGLDGLPDGFSETLEWIDSLSSREFLIPCVIFLKIIGAEKIFITDSKGDEGIDCIAAIKKGPMQSLVLFLQAKTSQNGDITRDTVLMEYGKYRALPFTEKYQEYRKALEIDKSKDGCSPVFVFLANREFKPPARETSNNLGVLLRSRIQLAYWISSKIPFSVTNEIYDALRKDLGANLTRNLSTVVKFD